ncbi:alpha/beta-hydrolase [Xylariaceae sp. AK1471]|nr:alpha/beta-hydrolase [Xylariaceae sp. AK1471]
MQLGSLSFLLAVAIANGCEGSISRSYRSDVQSYYPPGAKCTEYKKIPVTIISDNLVFNISQWQDDYALQGFLTTFTTRPSAHYPGIKDGSTARETATYNIAASFCQPKKTSPKSKTVILATHGVGLARAHWNSPFKPEEYNFVQHAISKGYSVFFYDRLGNGKSDKPSGYKNQSRMQREVLKELATLIRSGKYTGNSGAPEKVVAMGFAFGGYIAHYTMVAHPGLFDAAILTGVNYNTSVINTNGLVRSFVPRVASLQSAQKFGELDTGYLTWVDGISNINTYFKYPYYDVDVALWLEENKNPFAFTEFETLIDGDLDASNFTGPVLAMAGKNDYVICDGECEGIYEEPARTVFKNAKPFLPYLHPHSSHNLNFHHNATGAFKVMTDFLDANL